MPTVDPAALATGIVSTDGAQVRRRPLSSSGLVIGVPYVYTIPACGADDPIDFDGSFWDATGPVAAPHAAGVMVMMSATTAAFRSGDDVVSGFRRHVGNKAFPRCG